MLSPEQLDLIRISMYRYFLCDKYAVHTKFIAGPFYSENDAIAHANTMSTRREMYIVKVVPQITSHDIPATSEE